MLIFGMLSIFFMFHNILVCVDGSAHSDRALSEAIDLATAENARLTVLTAIARPPFWACTPETAGGIESLTKDLEAEAKAALSAAVDRIPDSVPVTKILSARPIRDVLMEQIRSDKYDLVVMGSRGRGALTASFLGSVSHFALNHSHVPVLIIHAEEDREINAAEGEPPVAAAA
jgi:nucleotide-binding universal stress UspA family protein